MMRLAVQHSLMCLALKTRFLVMGRKCQQEAATCETSGSNQTYNYSMYYHKKKYGFAHTEARL
jgi:hypothetical protein